MKSAYTCYALIMMITTGLAGQSKLNAQDHVQAVSGVKSGQANQIHPDAPRETLTLARLFGIWDAFQVKRNRDGGWSADTTHAEWHWYPILDGHAVQDDWISLGPDTGSTESRQVVGTNIRIYNAEEKQWHMAWIDKTNRRLAIFTATHDGDMIVMNGNNANGRKVRNTFFDISGLSFRWKQEWTFDQGETWVEVARIACRRKKNGKAIHHVIE